MQHNVYISEENGKCCLPQATTCKREGKNVVQVTCVGMLDVTEDVVEYLGGKI